VDQRLVRGIETKRRILAHAVELASVEGLEGLSLGRLADELDMSKAGVFAHFGSKEELQIATLDAAGELFAERVTKAFEAAEPGLPQLLAVCTAWLDYIENNCFRGGCFFSAAASELDGRPGPVREHFVELIKAWLAALRIIVRDAIRAGHLQETTDPEPFILELYALVLGANWSRQLLGDKQAVKHMRAAMQSRLTAAATARGKRTLRAAARAGG
jgi:AcrR family transcriptional regulator